MKFHHYADLFPEMTDLEFSRLVESMREIGYKKEYPIITLDGEIIDGRHRYKAAIKAGVEPVFMEYSGADPLRYIVRINCERRHMNESQRASVAAKLANMQVGDTAYNLRNFDSANLQSREAKISQAEAAAMLNVSPRTVATVKAVEKAAPELLQKIESGEMSAHEAQKEIKKKERADDIAKQTAEIQANKFTPPTGLYDVIVVDPPWKYGTEYDPDGRRAANPYPEMSLAEIEAIELPAAKDCVLWLWTTHKFMRHSFSLLDVWDFREVAILTWVKDRMGLGSWIRSQSEFCIMAVKGSPNVNLTNQTTVINGAMREHSRKPDEFYAMVNQLCTGYKLDYFARQQREGWEVFGNETEKYNASI